MLARRLASSPRRLLLSRQFCTPPPPAPPNVAVCAGAGAAGGAIGGMIGLGGGAVMVPLMTGFARMTQHQAVGTSSVAVAAVGMAGCASFGSAGAVDPLAALSVAATAMFGARVGKGFIAVMRSQHPHLIKTKRCGQSLHPIGLARVCARLRRENQRKGKSQGAAKTGGTGTEADHKTATPCAERDALPVAHMSRRDDDRSDYLRAAMAAPPRACQPRSSASAFASSARTARSFAAEGAASRFADLSVRLAVGVPPPS